MKIQIIIVCFELNQQRIRGFDVVMDSVSKCGCPVTVIEQTRYPVTEVTEVIKKYADRGTIKYTKHEAEGKIHKAAMMNRAARESDADYYWIVDADTLLIWGSIIDVIRSTNAQAYNPAEFFVMLNDKQSQEMYDKRRMTIHPSTHNMILHPFSPCSLIVRKDAFWNIGGFDERFIGYGWEDIDFILRLLSSGIKYMQLGGIGIHMWHPRESNTKGAYEIMVENNPGLFGGMTQEQAAKNVSWVGIVESLCRNAIIPRSGPDASTMVESLIKSSVQFFKSGLQLADEELVAKRRSFCQQCAWWTPPSAKNLYAGRCGKCGCNGIKVHELVEKCPIGLW